jgi:uncharacterized protein (DUF1501 family)
MHPFNRRRFLKAAAAGGLVYAMGRTPDLSYAQMVGAAPPFGDYKALVCLFLFGGNDSWNMVVPASQPEYDLYAASRQNLAIARDALLRVSPSGQAAQSFGFHPSMSALASLFEQGQLAVVANVGPLIAPTTLDAYRGLSVALPPQLFSHNDQQDQWHSLRGRAPSRTGWAGRVADALEAQTAGQALALNLSLAGQTMFQAAARAVPYTMGAAGPLTFTGFGTTGRLQQRQTAFGNLLAPAPPHGTVYERAFALTQQRAVTNAALVADALAAAQPLTTTFPADSSLATQLETVARLISVRDRLQMRRQVFFVSTGGFDTHDNQVDDQPGLLGNVSAALGAFQNALRELGVGDRVTTFTHSDFGRTLTSNGDGTDHAWGGVQLVMGDAVRGRTFYGQYPLLRLGAVAATDGADDVGGGRFIPGLSADQYAATLARWFGVADANMAQIAPSIGNFAARDLGFLV